MEDYHKTVNAYASQYDKFNKFYDNYSAAEGRNALRAEAESRMNNMAQNAHGMAVNKAQAALGLSQEQSKIIMEQSAAGGLVGEGAVKLFRSYQEKRKGPGDEEGKNKPDKGNDEEGEGDETNVEAPADGVKTEAPAEDTAEAPVEAPAEAPTYASSIGREVTDEGPEELFPDEPTPLNTFPDEWAPSTSDTKGTWNLGSENQESTAKYGEDPAVKGGGDESGLVGEEEGEEAAEGLGAKAARVGRAAYSGVRNMVTGGVEKAAEAGGEEVAEDALVEGGGAAATEMGIGEAALAIAPEAAPLILATIGIGIGLKDLLHKGKNEQAEEKVANSPFIAPEHVSTSTGPKLPVNTIFNQSAEFTIPTYDSVTDRSPSVSSW